MRFQLANIRVTKSVLPNAAAISHSGRSNRRQSDVQHVRTGKHLRIRRGIRDGQWCGRQRLL
jgi:hypothetical protein